MKTERKRDTYPSFVLSNNPLPDYLCPQCRKPMHISVNNKSIDRSGLCFNCGFCFYTKYSQMSIKELNNKRNDYNVANSYNENDIKYLPPIKKITIIKRLMRLLKI